MYNGRGVGTGTARTRTQGWKRLLKECAVWKAGCGPMREGEILFFFKQKLITWWYNTKEIIFT